MELLSEENEGVGEYAVDVLQLLTILMDGRLPNGRRLCTLRANDGIACVSKFEAEMVA